VKWRRCHRTFFVFCFSNILLNCSFKVEYNDEGLTALIFTSEGDMRQAINNLQSTWSGFGFVSGDNVFKVCDQPHPIIIQATIRACLKGDIESAVDKLNDLWSQGYSAVDIIVTIFRVVKTFDECVFQPGLIEFQSQIQNSSECLNIPNLNISK